MAVELILPAPAKLNLFLHVTGRRADGYHTLQTVFQFIDLADQLTFTLRKDPSIIVEGDLAGMAPEANLIYKAARLLQQREDVLGIAIRCKKNIPMGAGLGGGSSDAATTLLALNHLWQLGLSQEDLQALGLQLGADVPIFLYGQAAFAEGVGEIFQPITIEEPYYLLLQPPVNIATAKIFADPGLTRNTSPITISAYSPSATQNDLQAVVCELYPEVKTALEWLAFHAPARMTGSGSVVFAALPNKKMAMALAKKAPAGYNAFVCRGMNISSLQRAVNQLQWGVAKR